MFKWLKNLFGGSESSPAEAPEPAAPPEASVTPSEPAADAGTVAEEPAGDEPA
ncbi:MAG TPA: hypothetical protein VGP54_03690 [Gaiellaceae bacterium]|jgi:hypothetical protein|nr:hypothetical protein [Gaiellaceae bacterium]